MFSPSGMTLAGKYEAGVLSLGSMSLAGMRSLPNQWSFAEESAAKHGTIVDRKNWRILISWHIAETREKARKEARDGLLRTNNEYTVGTLQGGDGVIYKTPDEAVDGYAFSDVSLAVIGTPDDLVDRIRHLQELTGGFGTVVGFVHDWANRENTSRSWDMVARYVIPEVNGMLEGYRESQKYVNENRSVWDRAAEAVKSKITENPNARAEAKEDEEAGRDFFDFNEQKEAQKSGTKS